MQLSNDLTPEQHAAIIACLRIAAARGRAVQQGKENLMPACVAAQDGGDNGTRSNVSGIIASIKGVDAAPGKRSNGSET